MTELLIVFILAFVVEAVWEALKPLWPGKLKEWEVSYGVPIDAIGCLVIALLLCFGTGTDLLALIGVPLVIPYVGIILTAVLIYRGSTFLHDVLAGINDIRTNNKPVTWAEAGMGPEGEPPVAFVKIAEDEPAPEDEPGEVG